MHPLKTTSAVLAGIAVLAMILVQFLPWATHEETSSSAGGSFGGFQFGGFEFDIEFAAFTWEAKTTVNGETTSQSWYDDDTDGDGVAQVRTAIPMLLTGAVIVLAGALLTGGRAGAAGPVVTMVGGLVLTVGTVLFSVGVDQVFDGTDPTWAASFYLAITACALTLVGGVLALVAGNTKDARASF